MAKRKVYQALGIALFCTAFILNCAGCQENVEKTNAKTTIEIILTALGTWNDVMTPLVILSGSENNTLPLAQLNFQSQFGTNYNLAFASYLLALLPIVIFYLICQKQIIAGVANGAVK